MLLTEKRNVTLDTNCIIGLEEERDYAPVIRELIALHNSSDIVLRVVGISASERQPGGFMAPNFNSFKERLDRLGLGNAVIIPPPAYANITYINNSYCCSQTGQLLELEIHNILWPGKPFFFHEFEQLADKSKPGWIWKWRNPKCDTLAFMCHTMTGSGLFVSNDKVFHGEKKHTLVKTCGGDTVTPINAVKRVKDPTPFVQTPKAVREFLLNATARVDPTTVPMEFETLQANKRRYDEQQAARERLS